jgi:hypothetical protein
MSNVVLNQIVAMKKGTTQLDHPLQNTTTWWLYSRNCQCVTITLEVGKTFISSSRHTYNHAFFYDYDKAIIRRLQDLDIPFVDMRMLYSRVGRTSQAVNQIDVAKRSGDCLHYCSPGPFGCPAILLLQLLRNDFAVSQCV